MRLFGYEISFKKAADLRTVNYGGGDRGWMTTYYGGEPYMGAWQRDIHINRDELDSNWTVFACKTLIAGDVGKLRIKLQERDENGIWEETESPSFSPVLRKPNGFQTRQKFIESWIFSKLGNGNAYILKERDNRGVVVGLYVLDPECVKVLVADNGEVYYELKADRLAQIPNEERVVAPASEIIHDRMWCLFHPLVGLSPLYAAGLAATQGLRIQQNSTTFFTNLSRPSGILTADQELSPELAQQYKARWQENYGPGKQGNVAVLGNGLKYSAITQTAEDAQLVEQLNMTARMICATFHVPGWKIGVGDRPAYQNAEIEEIGYYKTALQPLMEAIEACLDEGLGLGIEGATKNYGTEFDRDALLLMDQGALTEVLVKQAGSGIAKLNELRARLNLPPMAGGDTAYLQEQNWPVKQLTERQTPMDAPTAPTPTPAAVSAPDASKELETLRAELLRVEQRAIVIQQEQNADTEARELAAALILRFSDAAHTLA